MKKRVNYAQKDTSYVVGDDYDEKNLGAHQGCKNDAFLASGSYDGTLSIWNLNTRICIKSIKAHYPHRLSGLASSNDGLTLVSVGWDGKILVS